MAGKNVASFSEEFSECVCACVLRTECTPGKVEQEAVLECLASSLLEESSEECHSLKSLLLLSRTPETRLPAFSSPSCYVRKHESLLLVVALT